MSQGNAYRRVRRFSVGAAIAVCLLIPTWTVAADSPGSPQIGVGAPVVFSGNGFNPRESLTLWENTPDGTVTPLPGVQTDGTGAFTTTVSFPFPGQWHVIARGATTNKYFDNVYSVGTAGGTSSSASAPQAGQPTTASGTTGTPVAVGASTSYSGLGFDANETIALWETAPGGSVTALPNTVADTAGKVTIAVSFPTAGQWQVTAHGTTSNKETVGIYAVGTTDTTAAPVSAPAAPTGGSAAAPAAANTSQVVVGAATVFIGTGFTANEAISLWQTGPGGVVTPLPGTQADGTGAFNTSVSFQPVGYWQVTAQGRSSGHSVVGAYNVTGGKSG